MKKHLIILALILITAIVLGSYKISENMSMMNPQNVSSGQPVPLHFIHNGSPYTMGTPAPIKSYSNIKTTAPRRNKPRRMATTPRNIK